MAESRKGYPPPLGGETQGKGCIFFIFSARIYIGAPVWGHTPPKGDPGVPRMGRGYYIYFPRRKL